MLKIFIESLDELANISNNSKLINKIKKSCISSLVEGTDYPKLGSDGYYTYGDDNGENETENNEQHSEPSIKNPIKLKTSELLRDTSKTLHPQKFTNEYFTPQDSMDAGLAYADAIYNEADAKGIDAKDTQYWKEAKKFFEKLQTSRDNKIIDPFQRAINQKFKIYGWKFN